MNTLTWLQSDDGRDWLATAPLAALCGRQAYLRRHPKTPNAAEQCNTIEAAIRGEGSAEETA